MQKHVTLTHAPIVVPALSGDPVETGAALEFHGVVRAMENEKTITGLFYEAYEPMAETQLTRIINELHATHPCHTIRFIHRLGWVPVGEASLYVRVTARHRPEAFAMTMQLIDRMKQDVPIWKATRKPD